MNVVEIEKNDLNCEEQNKNSDSSILMDADKIGIKTDRLKRIKSKIENMDKSNQISALYMLTKNKKIKYSENNNGTFINLTDLDDNMLLKIEEFIKYIELQKCEIDSIEIKKENIENIYFKQNKE